MLVSRLEAAENGNGAQAAIAKYILSNTHKIPLLSIAELAENTNTSYATVCRFLKSMNVEGFREFKHILLEQTVFEDSVGQLTYPLKPENTLDFSRTANNICDFCADAIKECKKNIDADTIRKIAETLSAADTVMFIGLGTSAISAQYAHTKFFRIKNSCMFNGDIIISKMRAALMNERSVLFAISSSGRTKPILEVARLARSVGSTVISLSDFSNSPLSKLSDISLSTSVRESNKYIDTDFPMIQSQITMLDILYSGMHQYLFSKAEADFEKTTNAVMTDKDRNFI